MRKNTFIVLALAAAVLVGMSGLQADEKSTKKTPTSCCAKKSSSKSMTQTDDASAPAHAAASAVEAATPAKDAGMSDQKVVSMSADVVKASCESSGKEAGNKECCAEHLKTSLEKDAADEDATDNR